MGGEAMASAKDLWDRLTIREIVENWALLRDARRWDRFRELWHEEGRMITTWIEGSFEEFIKASQAGYDKGVRFLHFLGGGGRGPVSRYASPSLVRIPDSSTALVSSSTNSGFPSVFATICFITSAGTTHPPVIR